LLSLVIHLNPVHSNRYPQRFPDFFSRLVGFALQGIFHGAELLFVAHDQQTIVVFGLAESELNRDVVLVLHNQDLAFKIGKLLFDYGLNLAFVVL